MLTPEQKQQRLLLYKRGLNDREIGEIVGCSPAAIYDWRKRRNLPANDTRGQKRGVTMEKALTPEQCKVMREFLRALVTAHKYNERLNVGKFINRYRLYLNGYIRCVEGYRDVPENMPALREKII